MNELFVMQWGEQTQYQRPRHFILDSGAPYHMVWNQDVFHRYDPSLGISSPTAEYLRSNWVFIYSSSGRWVRRLWLVLVDGLTMLLIYVPGTVVYLVSVGQMADDYDVCVIFYKDRVASHSTFIDSKPVRQSSAIPTATFSSQISSWVSKEQDTHWQTSLQRPSSNLQHRASHGTSNRVLTSTGRIKENG
jgi:hypothetical protein